MNTVNVGKTTMAFEVELLHRDLPKEIIDSAYKVHNALGCGLLEKVYGNALVWDIELKKIEVASQKEFKVRYRDRQVGIYYADLVVENKIIVEVNSVDKLDDVHRAQLLNYLRVSGLRVGLLLNCARPKLEYERLVV
jgi:GxxExxY protein